jgi:phage-related protein
VTSKPQQDNAPEIIGPEGLPRTWKIEFYESENGDKPVLKWIKNDLTATKRRALGTAMRQVLQRHGNEVCSTEWGASVAPGVMEFRVRMRGSQVINNEDEVHDIEPETAQERYDLNASEDILLRVFFTTRGEKLILLLHAYDKGKAPSTKNQNNQIKEAVRRLARLEQLDKAAAKEKRRSGKPVV